MCSRVTSARLELGRALHNPLGGDAKDPVARADHGALDDVLKLTHIPGPAPLHQRLQHLVRDVGDVLAMAADELLDEVFDEQWDVVQPLAQRWHSDRPRGQAVWERSFRERTPFLCDYRNRLPDGSVRYQHTTSHPVINDAGELVEYIGASMEMTEHWLTRTELERASQALRDMQLKLSRAAQVASVGELAADRA